MIQYRKSYPIYKLSKEEAAEFIDECLDIQKEHLDWDLAGIMRETLSDNYPDLAYTLKGRWMYYNDTVPEFLQKITAQKEGDVVYEDYGSDIRWEEGPYWMSPSAPPLGHEDNPLYEGMEYIYGYYKFKFYGNQFKGKHAKRRGNKTYLLQGKSYYGCYSSS